MNHSTLVAYSDHRQAVAKGNTVDSLRNMMMQVPIFLSAAHKHFIVTVILSVILYGGGGGGGLLCDHYP